MRTRTVAAVAGGLIVALLISGSARGIDPSPASDTVDASFAPVPSPSESPEPGDPGTAPALPSWLAWETFVTPAAPKAKAPAKVHHKATQVAKPRPKPRPKPVAKPRPKPRPKSRPKPVPVRRHWPVLDGRSYISNPFSSWHQAVDVAATYGSRIVPILSGRVIFAGWKSNDGGYQVWIRSSDGRTALYAHMSAILAHVGEAVTAFSTVIGRIGMSGHATGPHVHIALFTGYPFQSTVLNPTRLIWR